ncbi:hypothetical protein BU17DRAFT_66889 [Hysterangium stoloniferum]|nr:hypothetical protein BU17DRAFT_66889 [Hysterangium stoloniferum]
MFNDPPQGIVTNYSTLHEDAAVTIPRLSSYSTVEHPPPSSSLPDTRDSATVVPASKAHIPVSTPFTRSPGNGGPPMQNHTIVPIPDRCPSKEYHVYLRTTGCSCELSLKGRPSKAEKRFMCSECCLPFTTKKNGIRHARSVEKIHKCPICHKSFARVDFRNLHKKYCSGKKGQGFS